MTEREEYAIYVDGVDVSYGNNLALKDTSIRIPYKTFSFSHNNYSVKPLIMLLTVTDSRAK